MIGLKCLAIFFSAGILLNAYLVRRIVGTWLFPAALFALFWFAYTVVPLVGLFSVPVNPWAVAYIWLCTLVFSASGVIYFKWDVALRLNQLKPDPRQYFNTRFLRGVFHASALGSLVFFLAGMVTQGFAIQDLWFRMVETAAAYADLRYSQDLDPSISARISLSLAYLAATIGGLLFGASRSKRQSAIAIAGTFLPAVAAMLFQSAKGMLFVCMAIFFGGILVTRIFAGRFYLMDKSSIRTALWTLAIIIPLTGVSFLSRGLSGVDDSDFLINSLSHLAYSYAFGHLYAFSDWFSFRIGQTASLPYQADATGYGFYTFTSLFKLFGSTRELPFGTYDDFFLYRDVLLTNIYTIFRGLIIDFGLIGTLVYMLASGFCIHLSYYFLLAHRKPTVSVAIFIFAVCYFYQTFAISLLTWNTIPLIGALLSACLYLNTHRILPVHASEVPL